MIAARARSAVPCSLCGSEPRRGYMRPHVEVMGTWMPWNVCLSCARKITKAAKQAERWKTVKIAPWRKP